MFFEGQVQDRSSRTRPRAGTPPGHSSPNCCGLRKIRTQWKFTAWTGWLAASILRLGSGARGLLTIFTGARGIGTVMLGAAHDGARQEGWTDSYGKDCNKGLYGPEPYVSGWDGTNGS